jgi:uncharacterized protein (TIGR02996 family)
MSELDALLRRVEHAPDDPEARHVLADWLREHAQPEVAEWLVLEGAHQRAALDVDGRRRFVELDQRVDPALRARLMRTQVENCHERLQEAVFDYACPERWADMQPTDDVRMRLCSVCDRHVHFVDTVEQAREHATRGECVAISPAPTRRSGDLLVERPGLERGPSIPLAGKPAPPDPPPRPWWRRLLPWSD